MNNFIIKTKKILVLFVIIISVLSTVCFAAETVKTKQIFEGGCYFLSVAIILVLLKFVSYMEAYPKIKEKIVYNHFKDLSSVTDSPFQINNLLFGSLNSKDGVLATIFYLCKKGWLEFEITGKKEQDVYIVFKESKKEISKEAKELYEFLIKIKPEEKRLSIKEFSKYGCYHSTKFLKTVDLMAVDAKEANRNKGYLDNERKDVVIKMVLMTVVVAIFACIIVGYHIFAEPLANVPIGVLMITYTIFLIMLIKAILHIGLKSEKGVRAYEEWNAIRIFLSNFRKTEVKKMPDLKYLEDYIIYAMAVGSHAGVIKGFEEKMPELTNGSLNINKDKYTFLDQIYIDGYKTSFVWLIDSAIQGIYSAASD